MKRRTVMWMAMCLAMAGIPMWFAGCEGGGGGGSSHDFGANDPNVVACVGDSITRGYLLGAADSYPAQLAGLTGKTVYNRGVDGARSSYGVSVTGSVLSSYKPGYLLILFGVNDLIHGGSYAAVIADLRTMVQAAKGNSTVPIVGTLTPTYGGHSFVDVSALNNEIRTMASEEGVSVADLESAFGTDESLILSDGLHPSAAGAAVIARVFAGYVD